MDKPGHLLMFLIYCFPSTPFPSLYRILSFFSNLSWQSSKEIKLYINEHSEACHSTSESIEIYYKSPKQVFKSFSNALVEWLFNLLAGMHLTGTPEAFTLSINYSIA